MTDPSTKNGTPRMTVEEANAILKKNGTLYEGPPIGLSKLLQDADAIISTSAQDPSSQISLPEAKSSSTSSMLNEVSTDSEADSLRRWAEQVHRENHADPEFWEMVRTLPD